MQRNVAFAPPAQPQVCWQAQQRGCQLGRGAWGHHWERGKGKSWGTPASGVLGSDEKVLQATWWAGTHCSEQGLKWWNVMPADKKRRRKSGKLVWIPPAFQIGDVCPLLFSLPCLDYRMSVSCWQKMVGEIRVLTAGLTAGGFLCHFPSSAMGGEGSVSVLAALGGQRKGLNRLVMKYLRFNQIIKQ